MASLKRITKEYKDLTVDRPFEDDSASVSLLKDDYYHWQVTILGQEDTPYQNGLFFLNVDFPNDYPFKPPKVQFTTKIYHCNIEPKGGICIDILKDKWSPACNMRQVIEAILELLRQPDPDNALVPEIATLYKTDIKKHNENAADWVKRYAS